MSCKTAYELRLCPSSLTLADSPKFAGLKMRLKSRRGTYAHHRLSNAPAKAQALNHVSSPPIRPQQCDQLISRASVPSIRLTIKKLNDWTTHLLLQNVLRMVKAINTKSKNYCAKRLKKQIRKSMTI